MGLTVIGKGEVGRVFLRCAEAAGEERQVVLRGQDPASSALPRGPVVVAVREGDLRALLPALSPIEGRAVFVQNGLVDALLEEHGFAGSTRGLLWFTAKGSFFKVLAPSPFFGPEAAAVSGVLERGGVAARVETDRDRFRREVAIKLAWNGVVGLPLAVHKTTLATYLERFQDEARAVVEETCRVLATAWRIPIDPEDAWARLLATTGELGFMTGGAKALDLRNGAVRELGREHGVATPVNDRLLGAAGWSSAGAA